MLAAIGETFETPFVAPPAPTEEGSEAEPTPPPAAAASPLPSTFANEINGVIVSARKAFFRINIWTRSSSAAEGDAQAIQEKIENIGRHFKYHVLAFDSGKLAFSDKDKVSSDVEFVSHKDSQAKVRFRLPLSLHMSVLLTFSPPFAVRHQGEQDYRLRSPFSALPPPPTFHLYPSHPLLSSLSTFLPRRPPPSLLFLSHRHVRYHPAIVWTG